MVGGVVVMWRDPVLRAVTVATSFGMLGEGALPLVAALIAVDYHAGYAAGALLSAAAAGALVGALAYARRPVGADRAARVVMLGLVASGLPLLLVPLAGNVGLSLALFAVSGFFVGPQLSALFASRYQRAPAEFHTQVFTLGAGLKITAAALGAALAGAVASRGIGAESLVLAVAGLHIIAGAIALLLRGRGHRPAGPPTPAAVSQVPVDGCSGDHVEKL
jgi:MFS family permease